MANGGKRAGAGRKPKVEEDKVRDLAIGAIVNKYGSEKAGMKALLDSGDNGLVKWVFEHGMGKPKDKVDVTTKGERITGLVVEVIRTNGKTSSKD